MNAQSDILKQEWSEEIEQIEVRSAADEQDEAPYMRWFMRKSLKAKTKIVSAITLASLLTVSLLALAAFSYPPLVPFARIAIAIIAACGLVFSVVSLKFILDFIIYPFIRISDDMNRLADGALDIEVKGASRSDELGDLARSLEVFVKSGHKIEAMFAARKAAVEARARRKAEERERAEQERRDALVGLANEFESSIGEVVEYVASAAKELQSTAGSMADTAERSSKQSAQVAQSMEQASSGVTAAAAASDEFAMSIGEISRQAASSADLARQATKAAGDADTTISTLAESADQVGKIVELIQSIAQRTNLLALNASIEAARGGEAGRGFAVVASEVKELASQTSRATDEVAEQIRAMQDSTGASVSALRAIAEQINQLETTAVSIASAVDQQSVAGQDLARSIDLAARSTDEVADNIAQVRETSMSTGSAASQVLDSSTALESRASALHQQVRSFLQNVRAKA